MVLGGQFRFKVSGVTPGFKVNGLTVGAWCTQRNAHVTHIATKVWGGGSCEPSYGG